MGDDAEEARPEQRVNVYHYFPDGIPLTIVSPITLDVDSPITVIPTEPIPAPVGPAVSASLTVKEKEEVPPVAVTFTVDTTDGIATLTFDDDKGDTNAAAPAGLVASFTSDNPAALTITNDGTNPLQGDITVVGEGVANVGCTLTDADGNSPPLEADGVTPWPLLASVEVTVDPGAAVGAQLAVTG